VNKPATTYTLEAFTPNGDGAVIQEHETPSLRSAQALAAEWCARGLEVDISRREWFSVTDIRYTLLETLTPSEN
jgi:hypothetical protein